ncbi:MAG TPA: HAD hydrolase family protein [Blastocatellia bacterium]|jgi:3-deoxy-D-manno-octulosonate 8-phosphate phosphatase (KDO 8-P phosphatase)|nr:HAD hydrolase family protein [Blastocatellia bacterium]
MNNSDEIIARARHIKLLLLDCDGVLTDGGLHYTFDGKRVLEGMKVFHIHDGQGLKLAREAGLKLGIISGRVSPALTARARDLQIDYLHQGIDDKLSVYEQIKTAEGRPDDEIAYIGDDLPDLPVMRRVGLAIAVADAVDEIRECAHFVTNKPGGRGAAREAIELILKAQDKWRESLLRYSP